MYLYSSFPRRVEISHSLSTCFSDCICDLVYCSMYTVGVMVNDTSPWEYYTLNVWSRGKTKLTSFLRDHTLSVLLYI